MGAGGRSPPNLVEVVTRPERVLEGRGTECGHTIRTVGQYGVDTQAYCARRNGRDRELAASAIPIDVPLSGL